LRRESAAGASVADRHLKPGSGHRQREAGRPTVEVVPRQPRRDGLRGS